jgi:RNA polymerase-binding transcription factor DksA
MHHKTLKQLNTLRDNLSELHENSTDKLIESTNSNDLQNEIQRNVINYITETIDQIDIIMENIENGEYDETTNNDEDYD